MAAVSTQRLLLGLALLLVTVSLVSAVCPARTTYFDTETTYGGTTYFLAAYNVWKSRYVVNGGATGVLRVRDLTDCRLPGRTVSEGIGYGLILSVFAGDRTTFDQLRAYYNRYQSDTGCMPYLIRSDGVIPPSGVGCAPDGDEDVAFALFVASYKWNDQVYYDEAIRVVHRLYVNNVNTTSFLFPPFPQTSATGIMNPSYIALGYYRTFAKHNKLGTDNWNQVVTANDNFLTKIKTNSNTKLVPDWADYNGKVITTGLTSGFFGAYAPGQDATNTGFVAPSTALGAWPFKIEFLTNGQASDTRFIITQVFSTLGDVKTVWVQCAASGWKQTTPVQQSNYMVRIFDNTGCTYPYSDNVFNLGAVTIRIFTTTNFVVDYKNVDSKTPGCEQDRNQFPGTYSYDAVRYPWRTAFDAVYFAAGTNSYNRCKDLIATFGTSLDGERALSGAVLTNCGKGFIFKSMAAVCHVFNTDATARATVWTALKNNRPANPANLLADNTYFGDSLHVLALLFTTGAMNTDMCRLADAAPKALSAGYSYLPVIGAAWRSSPPAINTQFCIRASNNKNLDTVPSWTVAVEFQDPNVKLYNVYLNCGSGKVLAQEPRVDPFNTRYITSACASSTLQIELSPKQGYLSGSTIYLSGSISTVANRCNVTAPTLAMGTQHCWNWATNANYWSLTSAWSLGSSVTLFCGKKGTTVALTAQNGGQWPYTYAASVPGGCPTEMGSTLAYNGSKVFLTNAAYFLCPFYCFRPVTDNKITVTFQNTVSAVSIHCGGSTTGYQTATSPFANTYQIPVTGCAADGAVSLRYTYYGTVYTVNPNYKIVPLCFPDQAAPFTTPPPPPPPPPSSNNRLNYVPFCLGVGTSIYYIDVRTYATQPAYVNGVTVTCGTNTYTLTQDASNPERFFSNAACPAGTTTYEVTLSYTSLMYSDWGTEIQRTFSATMGTHKCPALCYQTNSNTDQYFLGVGVSYVARNATVTCSSTGPLAMTMSGGYFAGISMSPDTNAPLYNGMIGSTSSCTNVKVWIDAADQPAGNALPPNGSGYYTLSGQWYTATSPAFEPIPVSDPRRCFK